MRQPLTDALLKATPRPRRGRVELADLRCSGLEFRVTDKGARSFSFRFRCPTSGRVNRMTLGKYPDLTLSKARLRADGLRAQVAQGINPADAARRERETRASRSFGAVAERYLERYARPRKAPASIRQDEANLRLHILPKWQHRHIATLRRADVVELCDGLVSDGKPVLANRVKALISGIFAQAIQSGLADSNPCYLMAKPAKETPASRVLSDVEISQFWPRAILSPLSRRTGLALRLMLLTGVRPGEAVGLRRCELSNLDDPTSALWVIPGERTKNRKTHAVPLSAPAIETIRSALELIEAKQDTVFLSPRNHGAATRAHSLSVAMKRLADVIDGDGAKSWRDDPPTPHDLRRTVATRLASLGVPGEDVSAILNHVRRDVTGRVYDQYRRLSEKRAALNTWANTLETLTGCAV
jgi:integrase